MTRDEFRKTIKPGMMFNGPYSHWKNMLVLKTEETHTGLFVLTFLYSGGTFKWLVPIGRDGYTIITRKEQKQP